MSRTTRRVVRAALGGAAAVALTLSGIGAAHAAVVTPSYESSPVGWASQNGGTTGGGSSTTVTVTSLSALESAAASSTTEVIKVSGMFSGSGEVTVASNKTIIGVGSGSGLTGIGLKMKGVKNVIIRNMNISKVTAASGDGDAIHIESSTNIWVDHNNLYSDTSHDEDYYDGLLDITHAADYVTVSWNYLHDHNKTSLLGHSDDNASEDTGHLRVTYVHNWFNNTVQRMPRVRFGNPVHVLNNYYSNISSSGYAIASTEGAGVRVERNYFENVPNTVICQTGDSSAGYTLLTNNYLVNSGTPAACSGANVKSLPYSYTPDANSSVKSIVTAGAGTGKI